MDIKVRLGGGGETKFYRATAENVIKISSSLFEKKMITDPVTVRKIGKWIRT